MSGPRVRRRLVTVKELLAKFWTRYLIRTELGLPDGRRGREDVFYEDRADAVQKRIQETFGSWPPPRRTRPDDGSVPAKTDQTDQVKLEERVAALEQFQELLLVELKELRDRLAIPGAPGE